MNTKLLRKVARHIAEEPKRLDMNVLTDLRSKEEYGDAPPCGTVGCIAGWSCVLTGSKPLKWNPYLFSLGGVRRYWSKGRKLLGLTNEQADRLFSVPDSYKLDDENGWPVSFARRYSNAKTPRGRMLATVARIEHFIKTKGAE